MKRRKKAWIAVAALAGVVVLFVAALFYRPVRYRFLEGATLVEVTHAPMHGWGRNGSDYTVYEYRTERSESELFNAVYEELKPHGEWNWVISIPDGGSEYFNSRTHERVLIDYIDYELGGGQPFFRVQASHPTTTVEGLLVWLYNR